MGKKILRHWVAILLLGTTLTIGALSLVRSVTNVGENFAGFFFGPNLLVSISQRAAWPGIRAGLRSLDRIVAIDGHTVRDGGELLEKISSAEPGRVVRYTVERRGSTLDVSVPVTQYTWSDLLVGFIAPFLMGLLFVAFGAILYFAQPDSRGSLLYLSLCSTIGAFCMALFEAYTRFAFFRIILLYPLMGALSAHLLSYFPQPRVHRPRVRVTVAGVYIIGFVLVILRQWTLHEATKAELLSRISSAYIVLVLLVNFLLLARAHAHAATQAVRDKIKVIGIGLGIASSVVAAWSLNFLLVTKSFYLDEGILLASLFPLFMAYAVLRKNIFNLDRVIRLSLSYGVAGAIVLLFYLSVVGAVRELLPQAVYGNYAGLFLVFLAAGGAVLFNSLRQRINRVVHRFLFRNQYDLGEALTRLDRSLTGITTREELAQRIGQRLTDLFDASRCGVICLGSDGVLPLVRTFRWSDPPLLERWIGVFESEGFLPELLDLDQPVDLLEAAEVRPDLHRQSMSLVRAAGIEVAVPLVSSGKLFGVVLLGEKESQDRYDRTDLALLKPVSIRAGMALEEFERTAETDRRARLAALGQVATVMIHDIKNPLSTIKISAGSIKRRFREGDHSYELATIIEEETARMNQVVQDILQFVKPAGVRLTPCRLNHLVSDLVLQYRPQFSQAKLALEADVARDDPEIEADAEQVRRALENLLINAKDATPPGGKVTVRVHPEGAGGVAVIVEDTGAGVDSGTREKIFQPFFTTKRGGSGLGLTIVRQVMAEHGGEVDLESRPGSGSRFTLRFPVGGLPR